MNTILSTVTQPRNDFIFACLVLFSNRLFCKLRVGLVATRSSQKKRLESKTMRAATKSLRGRVTE